MPDLLTSGVPARNSVLSSLDKGTPGESRGRKATGPRLLRGGFIGFATFTIRFVVSGSDEVVIDVWMWTRNAGKVADTSYP